MSFDGTYAENYDALYHDKNYAHDVEFIEGLLAKHATAPVHRILDLGCGTGRHDIALAEHGHHVHGVDMSAAMLAHAESRCAPLPSSIRDLLSFQVGDIRTLDTRQRYDAVTSLFHVMSYQTTDADLEAALMVARRHLVPGGLFLFDFWHGPAIISEGPVRREKRIEGGRFSGVRRSNPIWDKARDTVRVVYDLEITDNSTGQTHNSREEHLLRYYFRDHLAASVTRAGFEVLEWGEWLVGPPPRDNAFSVYVILKAQ